eukprot:4512703-Prorocentrum_lima.AAC.1
MVIGSVVVSVIVVSCSSCCGGVGAGVIGCAVLIPFAHNIMSISSIIVLVLRRVATLRGDGRATVLR